MSNMSAASHAPTQVSGRSLTAQATYAGWMDCKRGRPFNPKWMDHKFEGVAGSYEFGRHCALEYKMNGLEFPEWKRGKPMPQEIHDTLRDMALADRNLGRLPTYAFPQALTTLRPEWLVKEDLANELRARNLGAIVENIEVSQTY